jgi:hypothetical protein
LADHVFEHDDNFDLLFEPPHMKVDYDFIVIRKPSGAQLVFNNARISSDKR